MAPDLQHALYFLETHDTRGRLGSVDPLSSDIFGLALREKQKLHRKADLKKMIHDSLGDKLWELVKDDSDNSMAKVFEP